jgi:hypothetical protein
MRWFFLAALVACSEAVAPESDVWSEADSGETLRIRKPARPVPDPVVDDPGVDGVYAETGIPCVRMGRCPNGEKCQYDQDEDANRSAPYCVDPVTGEKTGNVPRRWPWGAR